MKRAAISVLVFFPLLLGAQGTKPGVKQTAGSGTKKILFNGVYQSARQGYSTCLRLYEDGTVIEANISGKISDASELMKWFSKFNDQISSLPGTYTKKGDSVVIDFKTRGYRGKITDKALWLDYFPAGPGKQFPPDTFAFVVARKPPPEYRPEPVTTMYDGTWSGTTSQGAAIGLVISGGYITEITVGYQVPGNRCYLPASDIRVTYSTIRPRIFSKKEFQAIEPSARMGTITFSVTGKPATATSMNGELWLRALGCDDREVRATWQAKKIN